MLSKESKSVLYVLYKEYLSKRKSGISKSKALLFPSSTEVQKTNFNSMSAEDVDECICELGRNGYTNNFHASDIVYSFSLTDLAIVTLENQTKDTLLSVADFISKFIP